MFYCTTNKIKETTVTGDLKKKVTTVQIPLEKMVSDS